MAIPRKAVVLAAGLMLACNPVRCEPDVLMRAVGFALTGSDDSEPRHRDAEHHRAGYHDVSLHLKAFSAAPPASVPAMAGLTNRDT